MDYERLCWLFAASVTLHNLEEAIWLPGWPRSAGRWHRDVGAREFRFAVAVLTVLAYVAAGLATVGGPQSVGAYLVTGYALAMLLNVLLPHLLATVALRRYAPGTATAVLLNLPVTLLLIERAVTGGFIDPAVFAWAGPLMVVALLASIPLLFAVGRMRLPTKQRSL